MKKFYIFFSLLFVFSHALQAEEKNILVVRSSNLSLYKKTLNGFRKCIGKGVSVRDVVLPNSSEGSDMLIEEIVKKNPDIILTLGTGSTRLLRAKIKNIPIVFSMVIDPNSNKLTGPGVTLDLEVIERLNFITSNFTNIKKIGVIYSSNRNKKTVQKLKELKKKGKFSLELILVESLDQMGQAISDLSKKADCLLMLANPVLYPSRTASQLILQSLQYNIPIIASSPAYVKAGALAGVYADAGDSGCVASRVVNQVLSGEDPQKIPIQWPNTFKSAINMIVADRLKIQVNRAAISRAEQVIQ